MTTSYDGSVRVTKTARHFAMFLLFLVLVMGSAALVSSWLEYHHFATTQQQQARMVDQKLCATLDKLASLKAPAGSPAGNPSRAYEQQLAATLDELRPDIGCNS